MTDETKDESETKPAEETETVDAVTAYAEKHRLTVDEAKEELDKIAKVKAQYKNDPDEMARALRSKDREYSKLRNEVEKAKPKEQVFKRMNEDQFYAWAQERFKNPAADMVTADGENKLVAEYRRKYPAKSEIMSDDAVIEEIISESYRQYELVATKKEAEVVQTAATKREEIVKEIAESDKRFIPYVKAVLQKTSDVDLLEDGFDIEMAINLAKGARYDADIKEAEERGYRRAMQKPTIAGAKSTTGGAPAAKSDKPAAPSLNDQQKRRAVAMFSFLSEDEAYKAFRETYEDQLKKNKNFCT